MEIHWRNAREIDEGQRSKAEQRIAQLASGKRDLIDVFIDVEKPSQHHRNSVRGVEIRCQARGAELVARSEADDLALALREALRTFRREVLRLRSRRRDVRA